MHFWRFLMFVRLARVSQLCVLAAQWRGRWKARLRGGGLGHLTCLMKHDGRDYAPNYTRRTAPTRHHALGFPDPVSGVFFESRFCFPVLCRIFGTPKSIKDRAERPPFFFEFWSKSEYPYSANISSNFVILLEDFMCFVFVGGGCRKSSFQYSAFTHIFVYTVLMLIYVDSGFKMSKTIK